MSKTSCHFASILAVVVLLGGHAEARFSSPIIQLASRQLTNKETFGARQFQGRHTGLPVPPPLVALSDAEGQQIFREALLGDGNLKAFFPLVQELVTQATESYCGVATLLTSLNALGVDPGRAWSPKVPDWDWYGDVTMLNGLAVNGTCVGGDVCCLAREAIDYMGTCLSQLACIARANGLDTDLFLWGTFTVDDFRHHLASMSDSELVALNFDRRGVRKGPSAHRPASMSLLCPLIDLPRVRNPLPPPQIPSLPFQPLQRACRCLLKPRPFPATAPRLVSCFFPWLLPCRLANPPPPLPLSPHLQLPQQDRASIHRLPLSLCLFSLFV
uniref:glutathione gamma-glutamylcysteinyltransferase n=1 Tax=Tetraselmis sp. GSL018 TaxID=582737 RepID=A0A061S692_9CHLO